MKRIVITGATGWIGRAMVNTLINEYGSEILNIIELYASKRQTMVTDSGLILNIEPLDTIDLSEDIDLFVPLAFLTQEKFYQLGKVIFDDFDNVSWFHLDLFEFRKAINDFGVEIDL